MQSQWGRLPVTFQNLRSLSECRNSSPLVFLCPKSDTRMTYSEKLRDPRWQRKRLEVFQRDNFTCTHCGDDLNELQVHHLDYEPGKEPWEYPIEFLTTHCAVCHGKEQNRVKCENMLIQAMRIGGVHADEIVKIATHLHFESFRNWIKRGLKQVEVRHHG